MSHEHTVSGLKEVLSERYGKIDCGLQSTAQLGNPVVEALLSHRSVRHFTPDALLPGTMELLVSAAQSPATSSNLQTWSVISIEDKARKAEAATICGNQDFIRNAPLFLIFCADLSRLTYVSKLSDLPGVGLEYLEMFLMACIDASLAGQNVAIAAESLGLGICYVGAARNHPRELAQFLKLPPRVFAIFGMAIGKPDPEINAAVKPRLPQREVLHSERYSLEGRSDAVAEYDQTMRTFYDSQNMLVKGSWSQHSARRVATIEALAGRHILREVLQEFGFDLK